MSLRVPPPSPVIASLCLGLMLLGLTACAQREPASAVADGTLYARGLNDIASLYLQPVTSRSVALAGAKRLALLDRRLSIGGAFGNRSAGSLTLAYDGHDINFYAAPPDRDNRQWGELIARIVADAKQASPRLAALPQEAIDTEILRGMTAALDRFSRYSPPELARDQRATRNGFGGIGVTLDTVGDSFRVTATTPQGPAELAGIRPEDQIVAIDGVATAGCVHEDVVHRLRGPVGSAVAIRVLHPGAAAPLELSLRRAHVILPTVTAARDGNIAVFRITSFNHSTTQRIASGLADIERQAGGHLAGVVLDLRGDPGGLLDQAVDLSDLFIDHGTIVSTVGRHPAARQYFGAHGNSVAPNLPIAVLINGGSASAAEIVAATLQDRGRAVVIGSSSYGKGTVQSVMRLPNDGDLIITWARLVTPAGYLLQSHGVVPTLCTADLGDDSGSLETGLRRAASIAVGPPLRPRATLDEQGWAFLRRVCPPRHATPAIDLTLAERILADPKLYSETLRALPGDTRLAQNNLGGVPPKPTLTAVGRTLSSARH